MSTGNANAVLRKLTALVYSLHKPLLSTNFSLAAVPSSNLTAIVEPWFLGAGASGPGGSEFKAWQSSVASSHPDVSFLSSISDVPASTGPRVALISGRTSDNPALLTEAIAAGCNAVYLEKVRRREEHEVAASQWHQPANILLLLASLLARNYSRFVFLLCSSQPGAPTVAELESMKSAAAQAKVSVLMGYNKNVCKYVSKVREYASGNPGGHVTFVSNNAYEDTPESLGECFERNSEGMLKNMAIHELALLVSFYDVTVENIDTVTADKDFSSLKTLPGPSGEMFTDFDKIKVRAGSHVVRAPRK